MTSRLVAPDSCKWLDLLAFFARGLFTRVPKNSKKQDQISDVEKNTKKEDLAPHPKESRSGSGDARDVFHHALYRIATTETSPIHLSSWEGFSISFHKLLPRLACAVFFVDNNYLLGSRD